MCAIASVGDSSNLSAVERDAGETSNQDCMHCSSNMNGKWKTTYMRSQKAADALSLASYVLEVPRFHHVGFCSLFDPFLNLRLRAIGKLFCSNNLQFWLKAFTG